MEDDVQKQPDTQSGINNSWLRRNLTLAIIALKNRFRPSRGGVLMFTSKFCVKYGPPPGGHLSEAETMVYIARHTSIPVPKIYCAFKKGDITYILMERVKGVPLSRCWRSAGDQGQEHLRTQLHAFFKELQSLPPPQPGHIGDVNYSKLYDSRIASEGFGPFETARDFHRFLRNGADKPVKDPELDQLITDQDKEYSTCFAHGDFNSSNIIVRDGQVVGIIDWEMAGWYPEYWEYTSAWHVNPYDEWWRPEVEKILDAYPAALEMEKCRRKIFPMF